MNSITIKNIDALKKAAQSLLAAYPESKVFTFQGPMGAGKTTFIKAICEQLGVADRTSSPTFSLINEYEGKGGSKIYHFDFYRVKNSEEVYDIGYEDYFYSDAYCFIEWPEKVAELVPAGAVRVNININDTERVITY